MVDLLSYILVLRPPTSRRHVSTHMEYLRKHLKVFFTLDMCMYLGTPHIGGNLHERH